MGRNLYAVVFLIFCCRPVCAQHHVTRDTTALNLLGGLRSAMGGALLASTRDTVASAEVRTVEDGALTTHPVTIRTLGRDGVRIEADTPQGKAVFVMDARRTSMEVAGSEPRKYPRRSFGAIGVPHLPLLSIVSDLADTSIKVEYVGFEKSDDGEFHHVRVRKSFRQDEGLGQFDAPVDIFVDARSLLPAKIIHSLRPPENLRAQVPVEIRLSDYRSFNGIVVPFRVSHYVSGQLLSDYTFLSFAINQGARPSDFEVKP